MAEPFRAAQKRQQAALIRYVWPGRIREDLHRPTPCRGIGPNQRKALCHEAMILLVCLVVGIVTGIYLRVFWEILRKTFMD